MRSLVHRMTMRAIAMPLSVLALATVVGSGCGVVTSEVSAELRANFKVQSTSDDPTYTNLIDVNPADEKDVRDNCSRVDKETGGIREIRIDIQTQEGHRAKFGWGRVYARHGSGEWEPTNADLVADFDRVPLVTNQVVTLEATPSQKSKLTKLIFTENCDTPIQFKLVGEADETPVVFNGNIYIAVDFIAGL